MQEYGDLEVANGYLGDPEGLNEVFDRQGYLFFRGVLDADEIGAVRSDFMAELGRQGFVASGASRPVWTGKDLEELDDDRLYALDYYPKLLDTDTTRTFTERLFGGPVFMFRACTIRYTMPDDTKHGSPPHQDHFYIRHTPDFRTLWIPLMDVDRSVGGLAVAEGSHKRGLREHAELDVYSYVLRGPQAKGRRTGDHIRALADDDLRARGCRRLSQPDAALGPAKHVGRHTPVDRRALPASLVSSLVAVGVDSHGAASPQGRRARDREG